LQVGEDPRINLHFTSKVSVKLDSNSSLHLVYSRVKYVYTERDRGLASLANEWSK